MSIEETNRFAGNFDDPTRLASSFAGITSGSVNSNAMEIRGNSPQFAQWRMEGIETPNLSHYADMSGLGGGILTGLSLQTHHLSRKIYIIPSFLTEIWVQEKHTVKKLKRVNPTVMTFL